MKQRCLPAAALLLLVFRSAIAVDIDPIIVTATRTAQTADETLSSVTVITREEIERQQAQSIQDLLRGIPGVDIANNGGHGKATSIALRGTESDHVLVLIDGVKVGSATLGTAAFQDIPVAQIERIEIVRGPRSSLYGSEAVGGVIQIFTRKGGGKLKPFLTFGAASDATYDAALGVAGGGERGGFSASLRGFDTEGFNACDGNPFPEGAGCFTLEPDEDGYRNVSGSLRADYRFGNLAMDVHALRADGRNEFDGGFVNESETVQQVLGATARFSLLESWQATLIAGQSRDKSDNFKDSTFQSRFDTQRNTLSLQNDLSLAAGQLLTVGADRQEDRVDSTTAYTVSARDSTGLFTQYQGSFGAHDVQLSLRRDDNQQFGNRYTGAAAWGYALGDDLRVTASYGTAFKAPTFNELYFPGFGNSDLRPEESESMELGLRGNTGWGHGALNVYATRIDDLIAFDANFAPANIDQARIRGIEAILGTRLRHWDVNTSLTLLDPKNRSGGSDDGNVLPRRAKRSLRLNADRDLGRYRAGATLIAANERYDDLANTRRLGGYVTLDVRAEYALAKAWRLQARVENLFDKTYETAALFNQPQRSLYLTARYQGE